MSNIFDRILKYKFNINPLLTNRFVLYFFFFLVVIDVIYLSMIGDIQSLILHFLTGFLVSFFSKNMIVILSITLCVTHIVKYGTLRHGEEGMTGLDDENVEDDKKKIKKENKEKTEDDKKKDTKKDTKKDEEKQKALDEIMKNPKIPEDLKTSFIEYQDVQGDIIDGIKKIQPMLVKAENFISKYEGYKNAQPSQT